MRRLLIIAAAAATLLAPWAATGQDRGGWRNGGGGGRGFDRFSMADRGRGDDRGGYDRGGGRGGREDGGRGDGPRYDGRGEDPRGRGGYDPRYEPGPDIRRGDPRMAPPPYPAAPARGARSYRQGQYLPPAYRGGVVQNPGRYRLRAPPPGYDWVGVGPDIYLMQRGTGMVLDTIPGGF